MILDIIPVGKTTNTQWS